jgi:hypothetical protein
MVQLITPALDDAAFRAAFVQTLEHVHLDAAQSVALAEHLTGRPFVDCSPTELGHVLLRVRDLLVASCHLEHLGVPDAA